MINFLELVQSGLVQLQTVHLLSKVLLEHFLPEVFLLEKVCGTNPGGITSGDSVAPDMLAYI